jgi:hypothetical protein
MRSAATIEPLALRSIIVCSADLLLQTNSRSVLLLEPFQQSVYPFAHVEKLFAPQ